MTPTFPEVMTIICHLGQRDEERENEIMRKHEGEKLILELWKYRNDQLKTWKKKNKKTFPMLPDRPGWLHVLSEDLTPDENWKKVHEFLKPWVSHTWPVIGLSREIQNWYEENTLEEN